MEAILEWPQSKNPTGAGVNEDGLPATITLCVGEDDQPHVVVGTTRPKWVKKSWLDDQADRLRRAERTDEGEAIIQGLVKSYDALLAEFGEDDKLEAMKALVGGPAIVGRPEEIAQAFQTRTMSARARCVRCKRTFGGYTWALVSDEPEVADFEKGSAPGVGKCAEYQVYLGCIAGAISSRQ